MDSSLTCFSLVSRRLLNTAPFVHNPGAGLRMGAQLLKALTFCKSPHRVQARCA